MKLSTVELKWTAVIDPGRAERFLDIVVDGASLYERFWSKNGGITPMGAFPVEAEVEKYAARLLGELHPDSWAKQCCIYVCRACGDIDCGAVTVNVSKRDNIIIWSNFAFEYPDYSNDTFAYEPVEPPISYSFELSHLREALLNRPTNSRN
jgi:hypothetical protein